MASIAVRYQGMPVVLATIQVQVWMVTSNAKIATQLRAFHMNLFHFNLRCPRVQPQQQNGPSLPSLQPILVLLDLI
jgi:hypothetical protein